MYTFESTYQTLLEKGPSRISPFFIPMMLINMASGMAAIDYNMKGPCLALVTACASGAHNIGNSYEMIRSGHAKAMLVGSSEASITPLTVGGFAAMKAVSSHNDEPQKASRPFDLNRDGFVMGEGAAILLLEDLEMAKARGARIHAEIVGYGTSSDAYHFTQPEPDGKGAAQAMNTALARAGITPEQIDYINAHGTATPLGDIAETKAIKSVFGDHARKLCVSSSKSMFGHLLGAAGSIEAIISILAIKNDVAPPTINLETPDPECDLDYVANVPQSRPVNYAISNSFGFGGTNSVLAFAKYKD
jgi:3-oxoacyl-[acyl-carrier-protein] synthase II